MVFLLLFPFISSGCQNSPWQEDASYDHMVEIHYSYQDQVIQVDKRGGRRVRGDLQEDPRTRRTTFVIKVGPDDERGGTWSQRSIPTSFNRSATHAMANKLQWTMNSKTPFGKWKDAFQDRYP